MKNFDKKKFWETKIINWENGRYGKEYHSLSILEKVSDKLSSSLIYRQYYANKLLKNIVKNKVIIEIGCGSGFLSHNIINAGAKHYYGFDISENAILRAKVLAKKNGIDKKTTFEAKSVDEINGINGDILFSIGTINWKNEDERSKVYKIQKNMHFFHSYSEKRKSISQLLHRIYVFMSYGWRNKNYTPIYLKESDIKNEIKKYCTKNLHIYRNKKLSFGTFISTITL